MIEPAQIRELARFAAARQVTQLEISMGEESVILRLPARRPSAEPPVTPAASAPVAVKSPAFGRFQNAHAGDRVMEGAILGHVRLDTLLVPVRAPLAGCVADLPEDGAIIGFGDVVTTIQPEAT